MERKRLKTLLGVAMVVLGLVQAGSYAVQEEWLATGFGLLYAGIGVVYLWAEVVRLDWEAGAGG